MARVFIPSPRRSLPAGTEEVDVIGANVREVVENLDRRYPGIRARLCIDDEMRPGLTVAVDGNVSQMGLTHKLREDSEVHFLPAIGGGA